MCVPWSARNSRSKTKAFFLSWSPAEPDTKTSAASSLKPDCAAPRLNPQCSGRNFPLMRKGLLVLTGGEEGILKNPCQPEARKKLEALVAIFGKDNVFVEIQRHLQRGESWRNKHLVTLARAQGLPLVATNGVLHAEPDGRRVLDLFTCARHHTTLDAAGRLLSVNAERHLKSATQMERLFADLPEAVENTARVAERIEFTLENLGYEFPKYPVPPGETMDSFLRTVAFAGARARYSHLSAKVLKQLNFELDSDLPPGLLRLLSHCLGYRELLQPKRHSHAGARQRGQ